MRDDDKAQPAADDAGDDAGDDAATESSAGEQSAEDLARANIEKVDEILDRAGVNEGIAAGSRETHPDEGGPRL